MKANELMIGDWVYAIDGDNKKHPCRIATLEYDSTNERDDFSIDFYGTDYEVEWPDVAFMVEPIPLTPEILEKNGFKDISDHTLKGCNTFRLDIEQRGFDYCVTIKLKDYFKLQSYDDRWYTLCEMEFGCNYVHELQHALRLCGIDKEIVI